MVKVYGAIRSDGTDVGIGSAIVRAATTVIKSSLAIDFDVIST